MGDVMKFPARKGASEPMDDILVCEVKVFGIGDVTVWVDDYIQTVEQANWLIAKLAAAQRNIISLKEEMIG